MRNPNPERQVVEHQSRPSMQALIQRHVEAEGAHRMDDTLATLHPECLFEDVPMQRVFHGREGARQYYRMWWDGLSLLFSPTSNDRRMWTDTGVYVAESRFTGVHTGIFLGLEPTGRRVDFRFAVFVSFRDGLMAGERFYYDLDGVLRQLGASVTAKPLGPSH